MSSKQDVWMPLFIGDYLRDTTRLTTEKHGAYLLLIMDYWINGAPPDDDDVLSSITKMQLSAWKKARPSLEQLFTVSNGQWKHKRIEEELLKASENAEKYAKRAKDAANKRWNKDATSNTKSNATSISQELHEDMLGDATSPSPSSINHTVITHTVEDLTIVEPNAVGLVCVAIKREFDLLNKQIADIQQTNPTLHELIKAGATPQEFAEAAKISAQKGKGFSYLLSIVKRQREEAAKLVLHQGAMPNAPPSKSNSIHEKRSATAKAMFGNLNHAENGRIIDVSDADIATDRPLISANG